MTFFVSFCFSNPHRRNLNEKSLCVFPSGFLPVYWVYVIIITWGYQNKPKRSNSSFMLALNNDQLPWSSYYKCTHLRHIKPYHLGSVSILYSVHRREVRLIYLNGVTSKFRWLQTDCLQPFAKGGNITFSISHYERSNIGTYCFNTMIY